jgi:hypothetical protein
MQVLIPQTRPEQSRVRVKRRDPIGEVSHSVAIVAGPVEMSCQS